jgi:hypothetical protein
MKIETLVTGESSLAFTTPVRSNPVFLSGIGALESSLAEGLVCGDACFEGLDGTSRLRATIRTTAAHAGQIKELPARFWSFM